MLYEWNMNTKHWKNTEGKTKCFEQNTSQCNSDNTKYHHSQGTKYYVHVSSLQSRTKLSRMNCLTTGQFWRMGTALILMEFTKMLSAKFQSSRIRRCVLDYSSITLNIEAAFPTKYHNKVPVNVQHKTHKFKILPSVLYECKIYSLWHYGINILC
jgi:hypothetical protein